MHNFNLLKSRTAAVVTGAFVVVGLGTTSGYAAAQITSAQIANNTIQAADVAAGAVRSNEIADDTLRPADLGTTLTEKIASGAYVGENWSVVDRNVIGGGLAELRPGPSSDTFGAGSVTPPLGIGSLGLHTATPTDKAAFGNQVDFDGDLVSDLTEVGFSVYTTGENNSLGNNMPSIPFEIDPNLSSSPTRAYSSMVYTPANSAPCAWKALDATDDAQGRVWGLTGADMPCNVNGARCTWTELQAALADEGEPATIYTVQVTKGRDYAFSGAVDALTINDHVFDFEPFGVK
jgi:hypothetical protein